MLQIEKNYDFRKRMLAIHEKDIRNYNLKPGANQLEIKNGVTVIVPGDDEVIFTAARDFTDYLFTSMGLSAGIAKKGAQVSGQTITVELAADNGADMGKANGYKGFRIDVDDNILITGFDARGAAQGLYHLEEMMTLHKAPFITKETVAKKVIDDIAPKYQDKNGGYCRIIRTGPRRGDAAEMAIIELV